MSYVSLAEKLRNGGNGLDDPGALPGLNYPDLAAPTSPYRIVSLEQFQVMDLPERDMVLAPIIPTKGLVMLYAQRGIGKTFVGLNCAYAVATGRQFLRWTAPSARPVLYIDGEMPARALQDRIRMLTDPTVPNCPAPDYFRVLAMDLQEIGTALNLARPEHQVIVERQLGKAELVIFDNLSTLVSAGRENDAESWDLMQSLLLRLRRRGISVLMIHHAGRGDNARGTSKREDVLDTVVHLKRPENYLPIEGARFEVHLTKARGIVGEDATPFEARLESLNGQSFWSMRGIVDPDTDQVIEMTRGRMSTRDIAAELGIGKSSVARIQAKARQEGRL